MGMILTGRHVSAQEGYELGFVNEACPEGQALAVCAPLGRGDPRRALADVGAGLEAGHVPRPREQGGAGGRRAPGHPAVAEMAASQDYIEGPRACSEKRPPKWLGK